MSPFFLAVTVHRYVYMYIRMCECGYIYIYLFTGEKGHNLQPSKLGRGVILVLL